MCGDAGRAEQLHVQLAGEEHAQQVVEADEVIHVRMRDEHVRDLEQRRRRQAVDPAQIEQHRPPLMPQPDIQPRIPKRRVHQPWNKRRTHGSRNLPRIVGILECGGSTPLWGGRGGWLKPFHPLHPPQSGVKPPHSKSGTARMLPVASHTMHADRIAEIQRALVEDRLDAWLFCDFRGSDPIGRDVLGLGDGLATRRWFYLVPTAGAPRALVSAVEPSVLAGLPGETHVYRTWQELQAGLGAILAGMRRVAMQYSPNNDVPYVARVDAGTVELVRRCGSEVVSSADLVQRFEAVWSSEQYAS